MGDKVQAAVLETWNARAILQRSTAIGPIQGDKLNLAISLVYTLHTRLEIVTISWKLPS